MGWTEEEFQEAVRKGNVTVIQDGFTVTPDFDLFGNNKQALIGRQNKARGKASENLIASVLAQCGFCMIEKLENTWNVVRIHERSRNNKNLTADVVPAKVSGDYRAVDPQTGKSVLVEVKARADKLVFSSLKDHQVNALNDHHEANGISLLAWVNTSDLVFDIYLMRWPIDGFHSGTSINPEKAKQYNIIPDD